MSDWDDFRVFREVLRLGGFKPAAEALGVTHGTARAAVERLENAHGAALFVRAPDGLTATAAGLTLGARAERMAQGIGAFDRMIESDPASMRGHVRIAVNREAVLGVNLIPGSLIDIRRRHPGLILSLGMHVDWRDMRAGAADVAVRLVSPDHSDLVGRQAKGVRMGLFAHASLVTRLGDPMSTQDLRRFPRVAPLNPLWRRQMFETFGLIDDETPPAVACDNRGGQLAAVLAGLGFVNLPLAVAARHPELRPILPDLIVTQPLWVILHRDFAEVQRFVVVRDLLIDHFNALEGG
jgi:DNA-binding transcriptional LysR family regulator